MLNNLTANWKKTNNDMASTIVVINGLAITAGSNPSFFANIGRVHPINLAIIITTINVIHTTSDIVTPTLSINISFKKLASARVMLINKDALNSFQITLKISLNSISFKERPLIIVTDACPPAFPAESISIGINDVKITHLASASS